MTSNQQLILLWIGSDANHDYSAYMGNVDTWKMKGHSLYEGTRNELQISNQASETNSYNKFPPTLLQILIILTAYHNYIQESML